VGDGGYYDNSGLLSAVEWLDDARKSLEGYDVLLVLIDARPGSGKDCSLWSWQRQLAGAIQTLLNVQTSSQQVRESIELTMALEYLRSTASDTVATNVDANHDGKRIRSWHCGTQHFSREAFVRV